ncbi:hypothetical protein [Bradyrhizobium uaiense]|uniref:hypothetical protein n=1 Tax=Bradyrhizobium uaiense TaxID=2594946 RepID=UPI0013D75E93|nr:hypothetical protein [Bradyrhizobium uaiense]
MEAAATVESTTAMETTTAKSTACRRGVDREQADRRRRQQGNHRLPQHHPVLLFPRLSFQASFDASRVC